MIHTLFRPAALLSPALLLLAGCAVQTASSNATLASAGPPVSAAAMQVPTPPLETMKEVTRMLGSDAFEGRKPGTVGEEKSIAYITQRFQQAGLQPGNNGKWTQDVPLVTITGKDFSPLAITGGQQPLSFSYGNQFVAASYREQPHIAVNNSDVVFVGYGINAPEKNWNDYAGVDVRGKTVVILVNDPDYEMAGRDGPFNGRAMTYYGRWTYKYEEAARQGAAAALIIHDTKPAAYGWNVVNSSWTGPQQYAQTANGGADQTMANGWVQLDVARQIFAAAGKNLDQEMAAAKQRGFRAEPLGLKASLSFDNDVQRFTSHNVVGILPGTQRPNEYVLYSAHWDHLGHCTPAPDGDNICNGAVDNATGVAALASLAEMYRAAGPAQRSIVFLAVTAEEAGLLGSKYYAEHPIYPLRQTVGGVNMDALAMAGPTRNLVVTGRGKSQLDRYVEQAAAAEGLSVEDEPTPEAGHYYRSDHFSFAKLGVPMADFAAGEDLVNGGRAAGARAAQDYVRNRYHSPKDEYDPNWNWDGIAQDLRVYYRVGRMLADSSDWPNWMPGDEFRAIRDKSRGAAN